MRHTTPDQYPNDSWKLRTSPSGQESGPDFPIIVHSHLCWDWVWQRPQQFHSRFSRRHRILFVEGPVTCPDSSSASVTLREVPDYPNVIVVQPKVPAHRWSDSAWVDKERRRLVESVLAGPLGADFRKPVQWFYDPMAVTAFAGHLDESAIVYDCMDQLSQFRGAPTDLLRRERELLAIADVVFAGGPKMWRDKKQHNANCYSFGCGVDTKHFGKALTSETALPKDVAALPGPVYGYFGVVDERIDYELVAHLADSNPSGSVVMIGPWTKVDATMFPRRPNLHWLGARDYSDLPAYVKAFDVCLMPFALNEATEFINPTKALEYMATGRPIVSTAIEDVVLQFSDVVKVANSQDEFATMCAESAARPHLAAVRRGVKTAAANSWDSIVEQMEAHLLDVLAGKQSRSLASDAA